MPKYDARCNDCGTTYEWEGPSHKAPGICTHCSSDNTRIVWLKFPHSERSKDPYDMLDGPIPDSKRIFSGPKVSSKTTT